MRTPRARGGGGGGGNAGKGERKWVLAGGRRSSRGIVVVPFTFTAAERARRSFIFFPSTPLAVFAWALVGCVLSWAWGCLGASPVFRSKQNSKQAAEQSRAFISLYKHQRHMLPFSEKEKEERKEKKRHMLR
jgi:hypothetical protein